MSRSIHKTVKGVYGGKSAREMHRMLNENDPDTQELGKKYSYKNSERERRSYKKQVKKIESER
ncbi:hypothetical protein P3339_09635 [Microbulbifer sp. MLAF003]|uniref:hypothetical protein n=1 Tax=unclassified Microbulbifer TaxID=2619833 RepID=UPI0024AD1A7C|nr:hypothetical protein [Microbulbifer sp. MLAF003]WHI53002.1 hypothetical protein P3339_09635 [Microbulbifer sp. MLAF003]